MTRILFNPIEPSGNSINNGIANLDSIDTGINLEDIDNIKYFVSTVSESSGAFTPLHNSYRYYLPSYIKATVGNNFYILIKKNNFYRSILGTDENKVLFGAASTIPFIDTYTDIDVIYDTDRLNVPTSPYGELLPYNNYCLLHYNTLTYLSMNTWIAGLFYNVPPLPQFNDYIAMDNLYNPLLSLTLIPTTFNYYSPVPITSNATVEPYYP